MHFKERRGADGWAFAPVVEKFVEVPQGWLLITTPDRHSFVLLNKCPRINNFGDYSDVANLYTHLAKEVVREDKWRRGDRWKAMNNEMCARTAQEDGLVFQCL